MAQRLQYIYIHIYTSLCGSFDWVGSLELSAQAFSCVTPLWPWPTAILTGIVALFSHLTVRTPAGSDTSCASTLLATKRDHYRRVAPSGFAPLCVLTESRAPPGKDEPIKGGWDLAVKLGQNPAADVPIFVSSPPAPPLFLYNFVREWPGIKSSLAGREELP